VHFDPLLTVSVTRIAAPAGPVEAESSRAITADFRIRQSSEQFANLIEHTGVRSGIRLGRIPQRMLVDNDCLVDQLQSAQFVIRPRLLAGPMQLPDERAVSPSTSTDLLQPTD